MNCRDCNRPMIQQAHDLVYCPPCNLERWYDGTHWIWRRLKSQVPEYLDGMTISVTTQYGEWIADAVNWRKA